MTPSTEEIAVLTRWLAEPRVKEIFINTAANIEKVYVALKNRGAEYKRTREGFATLPPTPAVERSREVTVENLNEILAFLIQRAEDFNNYDTVRKSPARLAQDDKERRARAIAIEKERLDNDPVEQAKRKAIAEKAKVEAKALADAAEKEYWTGRAQTQPGENSLQCLQRYHRERVLAGKETDSSYSHPANILTPVIPAGTTVNDPSTGSQQLIPLAPDKPGSPDAGNWNINDAFVTTAKARNRS